MKNCMHLIERIFLQNKTASTTQSNSGTDFNYDQQGAGQQQNNPGNSNVVVGVTGTLVGPHPQIYAQHNRSRNYRSDTSSNLTTSDDQTTPTEVFSVSALYVTWPEDKGVAKQLVEPIRKPDSESSSVIGRPAATPAGQQEVCQNNPSSKGPAKKLMLWKKHLSFYMKKVIYSSWRVNKVNSVFLKRITTIHLISYLMEIEISISMIVARIADLIPVLIRQHWIIRPHLPRFLVSQSYKLRDQRMKAWYNNS